MAKYKACADGEFAKMTWSKVKFFGPYFLARPLDWTGWDEYYQGWALADSLSPSGRQKQIFSICVLGFQSHRDHFAVAFSQSEIESRIRDMIGIEADEILRDRYRIRDNRDWRLSDARSRLKSEPNRSVNIIKCGYRPFDKRYCYFDIALMDYPRRELIDNMRGRENLSLAVSRQIGVEAWKHVFVADGPPNDCLVSDESSEANYAFPCWRYEGETPYENLSIDFRKFVDQRYGNHYSAEELIGFIYAVLYAPTYRIRYAEFLRIDFPRIPFPKAKADFDDLSELGWALAQAHLLNAVLTGC